MKLNLICPVCGETITKTLSELSIAEKVECLNCNEFVICIFVVPEIEEDDFILGLGNKDAKGKR